MKKTKFKRYKNYDVVCQQCGKTYKVERWEIKLRKYCSIECSNLARRVKKGRRNPRKCIGCGKEFYPTNWNQKWCNRDCFCKHSKTGILSKKAVCEECGKEYVKVRGEQRFCCKACSYKYKWGKPLKTKKAVTRGLDVRWAKVIKIRAHNMCELCGKTNNLNSHHIFSRSNYNTRWDLNNGVCLCVSHHVFGNFSAHKSPIEFVEWLKDARGIKWYEKLREEARKTANMEDIKEKAKKILDNEIKKLKELS